MLNRSRVEPAEPNVSSYMYTNSILVLLRPRERALSTNALATTARAWFQASAKMIRWDVQ